ncbi:hypothetical protein [Pseudonocardia spinosispora]|uniref:hypothetical protein n=1 Tax=Pseudonocardia spinosispora TaxID=103441 RepID=UPI000411DE6D|nr:hypothetical protein [Pseudonocardia spinosispora]
MDIGQVRVEWEYRRDRYVAEAEAFRLGRLVRRGRAQRKAQRKTERREAGKSGAARGRAVQA